MKYYLLRHGETLFNQKGITQGWCDSPLTEKGNMQAYLAGKGLHDIDFECAYVSDLGRTRETFEKFKEAYQKDIPVSFHKELREMHFGSQEGEHFSKLSNAVSYDKGFAIIGGETKEEVSKRVFSFLDDMRKNHQGNVLVISHGWAIRSALRAVDETKVENKLKLQENKTLNCSISIIDYSDGKYTLEEIFDISYCDKA